MTSRTPRAARGIIGRGCATASVALAIACTGTIDRPSVGSGGGASGTNDPRNPSQNGGSNPSKTPDGPATGELLTCNPASRPATIQRLVRLTEVQYKNVVAAALTGRASDARSLPAVPKDLSSPFLFVNAADRFSTYSAAYGMTDDELGLTVEAAKAIGPKLVASLSASTAACIKDTSKPIGDCATSALKEKAELLFRRPATTYELTKYAKIASDNVAALGSREEAIATALEAILVSPQFVFRVELGEDTADPAGRHRLTAYEAASALSFALTDAPPDATLWKAAQADALKTPEQLTTHIDRLSSPLPSQAQVARFFSQYFRIDQAVRVFKDPKLFPDFHGDLLVDDANRSIATTLEGHGKKDFLKTLLTDGSGIARCETAKIYGIDTAGGDCAPHSVHFPAGQRGGMLTQPAFLVTYSKADETKPVQRGRFVRESLLCGTVPPIAIGMIPPLADLGPDATMRERLSAHSKGTCVGCHQLMDPIGLAFEQYDHLGQYRTTDHGKTIDASGQLNGAGAGLDGAVKDARDLVAKLAVSPVVEQCFVRHSLRYWVGRDEQDDDACSVVDATKAYHAAGGDYTALLRAVLTSDAFLYRKVQ